MSRESKRSSARAQSVAVIGAGVAGLTCAGALQRAGRRVRVFEKSPGNGGRCATRRDGPRRFDHGAQYFTARETAFRRAVAAWQRAGAVEEWKGRLMIVAPGEAPEPLVDDTARYVGVPTMSAIGGHLARDVDVALRTRITGARWDEGWHLVAVDGDRFGPFDALVVATPAQQVLELLSDAPSWSERVAQVEMMPCWAVMIGFDDPVPAPFDGAFVNQSPLAWVARNTSKPKRSSAETWTLHATTAFSLDAIEDDPKTVAERLSRAFADLVGAGYSRPTSLQAHRWRYARAVDGVGAEFLWDRGAAIGVCGDWCVGERVEGAWRSGAALAQALLEVDERSASTALATRDAPRGAGRGETR